MPKTISRRFTENAPAIDVRELVRLHGKSALEAGRLRILPGIEIIVLR
jgi:hypothetical protein